MCLTIAIGVLFAACKVNCYNELNPGSILDQGASLSVEYHPQTSLEDFQYLVNPPYLMYPTSTCEALIVDRSDSKDKVIWRGTNGKVHRKGQCGLLRMEASGSLVMWGTENDNQFQNIWQIDPPKVSNGPVAFHLQLFSDGSLQMISRDLVTGQNYSIWSSLS